MRASLLLASAVVTVPFLLASAESGSGTLAAAVTRTVYVTVTDGNAAPVPGLTAADFTVKEGGKERDVVTAEPATAPIHLSLLVEERLVGDASVRMGLFELVKRLQGKAETALITIGLSNQVVVPYTTDLNALVQGLNSLTLNPGPSSNLKEGVLSLAGDIERKRPERPAIIVVALSGGQAGGPSARNVLNELRRSGATMFAVTLAGGGVAEGIATMADAAEREQVIGDGAKQSGGRRYEVATPTAIPRALQQVAGDLLAQYVLSYTLPDGVKPDRRLSVSVKRRGVTLRAPSAIADTP